MSFGELALLYQAPRAATVTCAEAGTLWVIDRQQFKSILREASEARIKNFVDILGSIKLFSVLLGGEKTALAHALVEAHYIKGDVIIKEGDEGDAFYILSRGKIAFLLKRCP